MPMCSAAGVRPSGWARTLAAPMVLPAPGGDVDDHGGAAQGFACRPRPVATRGRWACQPRRAMTMVMDLPAAGRFGPTPKAARMAAVPRRAWWCAWASLCKRRAMIPVGWGGGRCRKTPVHQAAALAGAAQSIRAADARLTTPASGLSGSCGRVLDDLAVVGQAARWQHFDPRRAAW